MRVVGNRIIGKVLEEVERKTKSGIFLAGESQETATNKLYRAEVISSRIDGVTAGEIIVYSRFNGTPFEHLGEKHVILDDKDVLYIEE